MIGAMLVDFVVIGEGEMKIPSLNSSTNKHLLREGKYEALHDSGAPA